ncbi:glycine--tRNA ligase subunit beta [Govanella unica]|uniref:Glycine--tRNA ligase beta subunit n=1 Tax=Govanella unica TaxID=2975056 RepID=A0A9X3TYW2_9PROT|nr:glycine--tRNA ligase subunit beta [Govania unica]MDA5194279.1 glycine--tRNA ligase subunit beta [Govania unica]
MAELLLELFSEEIPARMQAQAADDLKRLVTDKLKAAGLAWTRADAFVTPRRLTLVIDGLPTTQPDVREERKGPRADAPPAAIDGFLRSTGLSREQLETRDTDKGQILFAVIEKKGGAVSDVIAVFVPEVIQSFPWPKSQRWGVGSLRWVRPLKSILCLLDGKIVPAAIDGIMASNETRGHRFLAGEAFTVSNFADYETKLRAHHVILDSTERQAKIHADASKAAVDAGVELIEDKGLLAEVAGLVEWPVVLMGDFDPAFLEVPGEVLTATMRINQKYFSLRNPQTGKLAPHFITVANMAASDGGKAIIAGNERVLRARLADAKFFWDHDLKITLAERLPALDGIVFHAKLGSVGDKVKRVAALAQFIAPMVGADVDAAERAAKLAKADLVSGIVGEFPEVQGIMGRYLALHEGQSAAIAEAIADHYAPQGPNDRCPTAPVSVAVALADKIDILVGFFSIDEKPTGSKDPFALRRAALGVLRIIIENGLRLPLNKLFAKAAALHGAQAFAGNELVDFFTDRLKAYLRDQGIRHDYVSAVFALGHEDDMLRLKTRAEALQQMLGTEDGANLLAAYRRGSNIVRIEEKKDGKAYAGGVDAARLAKPEEQALHDRLVIVRKDVDAAVADERWIDAMSAVATLRGPIDAFFDQVTVNDPDVGLRENRLNLLSEFRATLSAVADFSKIEG